MINWQQVLLNLRGYKHIAKIAREVGSDERHLNRIARGEVMQPRFDVGMRLLDLHFDKCRSKHNEQIRN
jgi:hypothetical protein